MPHLSQAEVHRVAALARLQLSDEEARALHSDLEAILKHVDALGNAPVEGVDPMHSPLEHVNRLRSDDPSGALERDTVLQLAPDHIEDFVAVPRVLEGDGA